MLKWWVLSGVVAFVVWVLSGVVEGFLDVKNSPREKMEWCHKHGYFREKHVLRFMNTTVCPMCYKEAWDKSEVGLHGG